MADGDTPVFPHFEKLGSSEVSSGGMTLRDWFAGQAIAGLCACLFPDDDAPFNDPCNGYAVLSYGLADAMLAARKDGK